MNDFIMGRRNPAHSVSRICFADEEKSIIKKYRVQKTKKNLKKVQCHSRNHVKIAAGEISDFSNVGVWDVCSCISNISVREHSLSHMGTTLMHSGAGAPDKEKIIYQLQKNSKKTETICETKLTYFCIRTKRIAQE